MPEELIISISGMRGILGQNLTASIAADYGCAFGSYLLTRNPDKKRLCVCIGRDSRPSGQTLLSAVAAGLLSTGIDCIDIGIISTPGVSVMLRRLNCAGGVVITASHNPVQYNGIKLLLDNGIAPPPQSAEQIKKVFVEKKFSFASSVDCGRLSENKDAVNVHIEKVLANVDAGKIASKKYKVVLDSVNGAGAAEGKLLLLKLGCRTTAINDEPTGLFAHKPEPIAENLTGLCKRVLEEKADVGFALDPDADRLAVVDQTGRYIGEEYTLALAAKYILMKTKGPVATNLSTSRMIDDIAGDALVKVIRTPVGEANVANAMLENNCVIGGEGNGGVIDLRVCPVRNSMVAMAFILRYMAETGKTISELSSGIPSYFMIKDKIRMDTGDFKKIISKVRQFIADAKINNDDGCRLDFDDGWLHLRKSNTEPIVRIIIEAANRELAEKYLNVVRKAGEGFIVQP
jgi:phosphomannomutase